MSSRLSVGTRFKDTEERRAVKTRKTAQLWKLVKAAVKLVDSSRSVRAGLYEIDPAAMLSLRHSCDELRVQLKMHELDLMEVEGDDE